MVGASRYHSPRLQTLSSVCWALYICQVQTSFTIYTAGLKAAFRTHLGTALARWCSLFLNLLPITIFEIEGFRKPYLVDICWINMTMHKEQRNIQTKIQLDIINIQSFQPYCKIHTEKWQGITQFYLPPTHVYSKATEHLCTLASNHYHPTEAFLFLGIWSLNFEGRYSNKAQKIKKYYCTQIPEWQMNAFTCLDRVCWDAVESILCHCLSVKKDTRDIIWCSYHKLNCPQLHKKCSSKRIK